MFNTYLQLDDPCTAIRNDHFTKVLIAEEGGKLQVVITGVGGTIPVWNFPERTGAELFLKALVRCLAYRAANGGGVVTIADIEDDAIRTKATHYPSSIG